MSDINECLDNTLNILENELKYKATVKKEYGDLQKIHCNPGKMGQVFMNLLLNAAEAIEKTGKITVRTWLVGGNVYIAISDTGCGISVDMKSRTSILFIRQKSRTNTQSASPVILSKSITERSLWKAKLEKGPPSQSGSPRSR